MSADDKKMGIQEVIQYLPHRYPFLMIDKVIDYELGQSLTAIKNVTINEPFFTGHFPDNAVMPGVLMVEALAQAGAILAYVSTKTKPSDYIFLLASADNAKFKQMVVPGDQLTLKVEIAGHKGHFWRIKGEASVDGVLACSVDIMSAMRKV
jgi:3-hydroxyacyl-[acyl-carrier-protein] dehydratase